MCAAFLAVLLQCFVLFCFVVNLFIKTDSILIRVSCMLEHVCYEPFSLRNYRFGRYLRLIGWNLCAI